MSSEPSAADVVGPGRVVVGISGSHASREALRWAASLCDRTHWDLEVVTAWPDRHAVFVREAPGHYSVPRTTAVDHQRLALEDTGLVDAPGVTETIENAHPVDLLVERSRGARLLVVGETSPVHAARGPGVGSLCDLLVTCPVVVVGVGDHEVSAAGQCAASADRADLVPATPGTTATAQLARSVTPVATEP